MKILILNGPNLNLQGQREEALYGSGTMQECLARLEERFPDDRFDQLQSNHEGVLIDAVQQAAGRYGGIVLNAGGYTHTSVALADAVAAARVPVVEVHITSILGRESVRHRSLLAPHVRGTVMGFGLGSYLLGVEALHLDRQNEQA